jgi:predicted RNA binding protein YcfA (HicA-like mRNA interferase family)
MGKHDKLLFQILRALSDANIGFDEMCSLLKHLEFEVRIRGSHHIFRKAGVAEKINLQKDGAKVKSYQVRQVRSVILKHGLAQEA